MALFHMATLISLSVLASFATGFLCLLVVGIKWASSVKRDIIEEGNRESVLRCRMMCARCGTSFFDNLSLALKDVLCNDCKSAVCSACAINYHTFWLCSSCIKTRDSEIEKITKCSLNHIKQRFPVLDHPTRKFGKRERDVRNLVEALAENILGDLVGNAIINRLSENVAYVEFMEKYEGVLSLTLLRLKTCIQIIVDGVTLNCEYDDAKNIELQLRDLIKEIVKEASTINIAKESTLNNKIINSISLKTYEDLLATAIINKILEKLSIDKDETMALVSLPEDGIKKQKESVVEDDLGNIELETKIRDLQNNTTLQNSWNKENFTFAHLGFDLAHNIEGNKRWEENWLFRRKNVEEILNKGGTYRNRTGVPMFVPSPNVNVSPKIGESNVDDLSDSSDFSDSEIEAIVYKKSAT